MSRTLNNFEKAQLRAMIARTSPQEVANMVKEMTATRPVHLMGYYAGSSRCGFNGPTTNTFGLSTCPVCIQLAKKL